MAAGLDLFSALRAGGVPIASSCTGRRICGRCIVRVEGGEAGRIAADEAEVLTRDGAAPDERLACRVFVEDDGLIVSAGYW